MKELRSLHDTPLMKRLEGLADIPEFTQRLKRVFLDFALDDSDSDTDSDSNSDSEIGDEVDDAAPDEIGPVAVVVADDILSDTDTEVIELRITDSQNVDVVSAIITIQPLQSLTGHTDIDHESDDEKYEGLLGIPTLSTSGDDIEDDNIISYPYSGSFDPLYCSGHCGNAISDYIRSIKYNDSKSISVADKSRIIARCFMSYDYDLRIELIALIQSHYPQRDGHHHHQHQGIIEEMWTALRNEDEYFDSKQWIHKFDELFGRILETKKGFILDKLALRGCRRNWDIPLMVELQRNSDRIIVDTKWINTAKKSKEYGKMVEQQAVLRNDEIVALCTFIEYQREFVNENINSCRWKQFHCDLCRGIKTIHSVLDTEDKAWPEVLYCDTKGIDLDQETLTVQSVTYWTTEKSSKEDGEGKLLEIQNVQDFVYDTGWFVIGIPVEWMVNSSCDEVYDQWVFMPFIASSVPRADRKLFHVNVNDPDHVILTNSGLQ